MRYLLFILGVFISFLCAEEPKVTETTQQPSKEKILAPEQIEVKLEKAQRDYEIAEKMFIPWYTGPLITGSASNVDLWHFNIATPVYFTVTHGDYNSNRKSINVTNTYNLNPQAYLQTGITHWLDVTLGLQGDFRWKSSYSTQRFGDISLAFGFALLKGSSHTPYIRLILTETFPTGKYKNLNSSKADIDSSGGGIYNTAIGVNISKIFWWFKLHPINLRFGTNYSLPNNKAHVSGFHAYGGGFQTAGSVKVGHVWNADAGIEVSLNQKWVIANDFTYTYSTKSSFSGVSGTTATGAVANNGFSSSDQFAIAPAIEYNVSDTGGLIMGVWFTVTGRNSANFATVIIAYSQYF